ncbi:MAG: hypothetical protein JNK85_01885 [Verrucomicrobiales bacterium]|nr:hypothetical protein [Verrucomicrobiales bacterium]
MHPRLAVSLGLLCLAIAVPCRGAARPVDSEPAASLGPPGTSHHFRLESPASTRAPVQQFTLALGEVDQGSEGSGQWVRLEATTSSQRTFRIWLLVEPRADVSPWRVPASAILRYILQEGTSAPVETVDGSRSGPVLPSLLEWPSLWPAAVNPGDAAPEPRVQYLGHAYRSSAKTADPFRRPSAQPRRVRLYPDRWIGVPSNQRQKDPRRRYDNSEYEYQRLTREDYQTMIEAGMTCLRVDAEQAAWVEAFEAFYWGVSPVELAFPECLYRSAYLGPALFLDEPAVVTRDHTLRPRLEKEPDFRRTLTPQVALAAFEEHFRQVLHDGAPSQMQRAIRAQPDLDLGTLPLRQANLYSWETMIATAAYQLAQDPLVPSAIVFEPPGRLGTTRTLPEMNMAYGCQIPVDDPKNLTSILYGFLRGAARQTGKSWGTSIYGAVDGRDAPWFLTQAYDLGATRFFFWDNAALACVPFDECLALTRILRRHADSRPARHLERLKQAAEIAILLPPGYNLGHVHMGRGNLWGLGELNLERVNSHGIPYRNVMSALFLEIEQCQRDGVAFDLLWDLSATPPKGYREVRRILETAEVEVHRDSLRILREGPRRPVRPAGVPPEITVNVSQVRGRAPLDIVAQASVRETAAPVYYTHGADPSGLYHNAAVLWEVFGPADEDYRFLMPPQLRPSTTFDGRNHQNRITFRLDRPGIYRLRVATCDLAGRTSVRWNTLTVEP